MLDTNVLVAAFVAKGACHELVEHCEREHEIVTCDVLLNEFERVLAVRLGVPEAEAREARALLESRAVWVRPAVLDGAVSRDPDDDVVLATAIAGRCTCIVSGDQDLLVVGSYAGMPILAPAAFWSFEAAQAGRTERAGDSLP